MTLRPAALALVALLSACASDPGDGPADASSDTSADVAAVDVSDARGGDVTDAAQDTPAVDAPADVASDAGGDAADVSSPDVVSVDGGHDAGADAGDALPSDAPSDASTDASDAADAGTDAPTDAAACVEGAVRCDGTLTAQTCRGGVWVSTTCRGFSAARNTYEVCYAGACFDCNAGDGGVGCSLDPPLCQTDAECYSNGRGRCVLGRCARRGPVECATDTDCEVWAPFSSDGCSAATIAGRATRVCSAGNATRCTVDAMCPDLYRCDTATGFCARR